MAGKTYAETHEREIKRMRELGIQYKEKVTQVYICAQGEARPKRRYLLMGRSIHEMIVLACKLLGISQWKLFETVAQDLWSRIFKLREESGQPQFDLDVQELVRVDDLLWCEDEFKAARRKGTRIVVHENDGIPLAIKQVAVKFKGAKEDAKEDS